MQALADFFPLILFLVAYFLKDIYFALAVLMIAMPIGLAIKYFKNKRVDKMYMWSTVLLLVLGAATLYFRNPVFYYWKPTALNWAAAMAFLASMWIGSKPLAQRFLEQLGELPTGQIADRQWRILNLLWVAFFLMTGLLNIYVAYNFSEAFWVKFKVFGLLALTVVFVSAQGLWIMSKLSDSQVEIDHEDIR
jgi:intracellular septation protein